MRNIALLGDTQIWTHELGPVAIKDIQAPVTVYSPFGKPTRIKVEERDPQQIAFCHLDTGATIGVGVDHEFLVRDYDSPALKTVCARHMIAGANSRMYMSPMPSRKYTIGLKDEEEVKSSLMMSLETYEDGKLPENAKSLLFLNIDGIEDMVEKFVNAGFYGMTSRINQPRSIIELDENRPSCFPTKLLINSGLDDMVSGLVDKQVLRPCMPYDAFIAMGKETGVLFEGYGVNDMRTILGVQILEQTEAMWTVICDDPATTIETAFIRV